MAPSFPGCQDAHNPEGVKQAEDQQDYREDPETYLCIEEILDNEHQSQACNDQDAEISQDSLFNLDVIRSNPGQFDRHSRGSVACPIAVTTNGSIFWEASVETPWSMRT